MTEAERIFELGELLRGSPYLPVEWLGRGAVADVFVVQHQLLGKRFAMKLVHPHLARAPGYIERLKREARALGRIDPRHVVRVIDLALATNGAPYLVLELMKGQSLGRELLLRGALPVSEAISWARQTLEGLTAAHACGVVHRDISPENLFLMEVPGYARSLKILDFGLAGILPGAADASIKGPAGLTTSTGMLLGSPGYASPEALRRERADERADVFGVGVVLFEMLTGLSPFDLEDTVFPAPSTHAPRIPTELDQVVLKGLMREPSERHQTAAAFITALEPFEPRESP